MTIANSRPMVGSTRAATWSSLPAFLASVLVALAAGGAAAFAPVDYRAADATIVLTRAGTYDGGYFATRSAEVPPAYDASKRRLYYLNRSRNRIDVLDIDDPAYPHRDSSIGLGPIGLGDPSVVFRSGVLATAFAGPPSRAPAWSPSSIATAGRRRRRSPSVRSRRCWCSRRMARNCWCPGGRGERRLQGRPRRYDHHHRLVRALPLLAPGHQAHRLQRLQRRGGRS